MHVQALALLLDLQQIYRALMEYSPPPLFKQGASARVKVVFFSLIAIALLVADSRMRSLTVVRQVVGAALYPLQMAALVPRDVVQPHRRLLYLAGRRWNRKTSSLTASAVAECANAATVPAAVG